MARLLCNVALQQRAAKRRDTRHTTGYERSLVVAAWHNVLRLVPALAQPKGALLYHRRRQRGVGQRYSAAGTQREAWSGALNTNTVPFSGDTAVCQSGGQALGRESYRIKLCK